MERRPAALPLADPQHDPDVRLMLRVRDDDALAFEELVTRYQVRLLSVLEHLLGDKQQAEDVAQETFLRVYRARKSYVPTARFATWLFTIANNAAQNARRRQSRRKEVQPTLEGSGAAEARPLERLAAAASGWMPARRLDKAELAQIVRSAVEALNERQRMALLLSKFEGLSYQEIADAMELTVEAVKSLLWRARENLRTILEPYLQDGSRPGGDVPNLSVAGAPAAGERSPT